MTEFTLYTMQVKIGFLTTFCPLRTDTNSVFNTREITLSLQKTSDKISFVVNQIINHSSSNGMIRLSSLMQSLHFLIYLKFILSAIEFFYSYTADIAWL